MIERAKFIDRTPCVPAAGIPTVTNGAAVDSLKVYSDEEAADNIIKAKCLYHIKMQRKEASLPQFPFIPDDNVKDILSPDLKKSRFVAFREKFSEDMYFKKPELGKAFPAHTKPDSITNENTLFGDPSNRSDPLYDVILPRKSPDEVNRDYIRWHDKYIISHQHYLPGERRNRNYDPKSFDPKRTFGANTNVDRSGKYVKRAMVQNCGILVISKAQKDYLERTLGRLGRNINRRNPNITKGMTFGMATTKDVCNVKGLMENMNPCELENALVDAIGHVNKLRQKLFSRLDFHMFDLKTAFESKDPQKTGYLPLEEIFKTLRSELIHYNDTKLLTALQHFNMLEDADDGGKRVKYNEFWQLLHIQYPLPKTGNISKMPPNIYNKETTYRVFCSDRLKEPVQAPKPKPAPTAVRKVPIYLDEPTTAKDVIAPDIPMHFGLGPSDFSELRPQEELRRIFKRILTQDKFDEVWDRARSKLQPANDLLSVDQMRDEMNFKENKDKQ